MILRVIPFLKLTYLYPLKIDGWKTTFLLEWPIFRAYVSFREGIVFVVSPPAVCPQFVARPRIGPLLSQGWTGLGDDKNSIRQY